MLTIQPSQIKKVNAAQWSNLPDRRPQYALVAGVDLVVIRYDDSVSVLYGRCQHRGAQLADGSISSHNLICGLHNLDGRGGGTGAAPDIFKRNISVPTIPALARARRHLDKRGRRDVTLIINGGLRTESDFVKALALGADDVAVSNAAIQAIGCLGMRVCHTNNCPVGIATQKKSLRARLIVEQSAEQLKNYIEATVHLMQVLARACGHSHLNQFCLDDLTTYHREMAYLTGIRYGGVG